ncbi:MAG: L,D-transpeptidase family protein [Salaquimonas sp.]
MTFKFLKTIHLSSVASITILACATTLGATITAQASGLTEVTLKLPRQAPSAKPGKPAATDGTTTATIRSDSLSKKRSHESDEANQPLVVTVSLDKQQLTLFRGIDPIKKSKISSGKEGHSTPTGIFSILGKKKYHESNIYSDAPMPYMQRLTWSGIALHESGSVPSFPASHGCVRLPRGFAKELYSTTPHGTHVVITPEPVRPSRVDHPTLFRPIGSKPALAALRLGISDYEASLGIGYQNKSDTKTNGPLRIYVTRATRRDKIQHVQKMLNSLGYSAGEPDGIYGKTTIASVRRFQRLEGLKTTGTLSDETLELLEKQTGSNGIADGKLFIRQNQKPVFESPIAFREPHKPLGTHLLLTTALTTTSANWIGVSISSRIPRWVIQENNIDKLLAGKRLRVDVEDALDQLIIPKEAKNFIEENLSENSSFAISDNGLGTETGKGTDFIVQTY